MATHEEKMDLGAFLVKADWEGGIASLIFHSGIAYWPEALKESGRKFEEALMQAEKDIDDYALSLGFANTDEAYRYWEEMEYDRGRE